MRGNPMLDPRREDDRLPRERWCRLCMRKGRAGRVSKRQPACCIAAVLKVEQARERPVLIGVIVECIRVASAVGIRPSREPNVESRRRPVGRRVGQRVRQVRDDRLVDKRVERLE